MLSQNINYISPLGMGSMERSDKFPSFVPNCQAVFKGSGLMPLPSPDKDDCVPRMLKSSVISVEREKKIF